MKESLFMLNSKALAKLNALFASVLPQFYGYFLVTFYFFQIKKKAPRFIFDCIIIIRKILSKIAVFYNQIFFGSFTNDAFIKRYDNTQIFIFEKLRNLKNIF